MNRRTFLCGLTLGTLFAPLASEAQRPGNVPRVGVLFEITPVADMIGSEPKNVAIGAFLRGLRELGYIEGQNVVIDRRSDEGTGERLPALAAELVRLNVDVILAGTERVVQAAMEATSTIPIVAPAMAAPVERAFAKSLARPGGNVTGLTSSGQAIDGKRLQLLKEAAPTITYVAFLHLTSASSQLGELSTAARVLRVTLLPAIVDRPGQFTNAFAVIGRKRADALLAGTNVLTYLHRRLIVDFAARSQLPAMSGFRDFADDGGLMSYGPSIPDQFRRAATYVDRILKGAKPGDLPIEQPTKFELVINAKTAKALGLTLPQSLLLRADLVIE